MFWGQTQRSKIAQRAVMEFVGTEDVNQTNLLALALAIAVFVAKMVFADTTREKLLKTAQMIAPSP